MQSPADILRDLWPPSAVTRPRSTRVRLTGEEPQIAVLVSRRRRRTDDALPPPGLPPPKSGDCAAARRRTSPSTCATPSSNAAANAICASTTSRRRPPGTPSPASTRPATAASCGCHTNFPHHRDAVCKVLSCEPERERRAGRADAMEGRGVRDRGLCRRLRRRLDALPRRMVGACRRRRRSPNCR